MSESTRASHLRWFAVRVVATCLAAACLPAQQNRVVKKIDAARVVPLQGHIHPKAHAESDRGQVDPSFPIAFATLHLKSSEAQQSALEKLLIDQQDPGSAQFHHWLSPEEFGDSFGVSRDDVTRITRWLESSGLKVNDVARGRRWITFSGSARDVGRSLHTEFHRFMTDGEEHFANTVVPWVPEALQDVIAGIDGLDDFYPTRPVVPAPAYTSGNGSHYLAPDDLATIYNWKALYSAGIDGTGQTIAVIGNTSLNLTDIRSFRTRFNLPSNDPKLVLVGPDPGVVPQDEAYMDLEWAGAVARNAKLVFVYAKSVNTAVQYTVDQKIAPIITESFGGCEAAQNSLLRPTAQQASAEGITWVASSGDVGAAGCERQGYQPSASKGLAVQTPASIPEVTAVGGTEFDDASGRYWNSSNSNGASALSYIPETAWNDCAADWYLASSTGGRSILYSKPWWQSGPGVPADGRRDVPDIALSSSWSHVGYIVYANGGSGASGGTSAAAPVFAGFLGLLNQYLMSKGALSQPGLGNINPTLYRLAQSAPSAFHDIVKGDNIVRCMQGTPDCADGWLGFSTGPGYDLVTGLGSIDGYQLATNWTSGTATSTIVSATPSTLEFNSGTIRLSATVKGAGGTPAGDVTFLSNQETLGTATLSNGSASLTINALQMPVGSNTVIAAYAGGAGGWTASAGTTTVVITPPSTSAVVVTVSPNPVYQVPPDSAGYTWSYTVRLTNQSSVPTTLTKFTIGSTDYTSNIVPWFGTASIPGNGSISGELSARGLDAPVERVYAFSGADGNGATWSQKVTVQFLARTLVTQSLLLITPASIPSSSGSPSCRWSQPLVLEEQGGYGVQLSTLSANGTDASSQIQRIFGTTSIGPYGRLQGNLCWSAAGSAGLTLSGTPVEYPTRSVTTRASASLSSSAAAGIAVTVSPDTISMLPGTTATLNVGFSSGNPAWTARVSPVAPTTNWLSISPVSGNGPAQLTLTASATGLAAGVYNAMVLIQSATATPQFLSVPVVMVVGGSSDIMITAVSNAASYQTTAAPGMLMSVWGTNLAPATEHAGAVPLPLTMQGVKVTVNGNAVPLLDVTPALLNVQLPYETGAGVAVLGVNNNGKVASFLFPVQTTAPGIFMSLDGNSNLVPYTSGKRGQVLFGYVTGEGSVTPALITGRTPTTTDYTKLPAPMLPVSLTVGGVPAVVYFAGTPNGLVGLTQINFGVPDGAPLGRQPVVVSVGGVASPPVMLTVTQ